MQISLATDTDGFLAQECPACERGFKVKLGEGSDQPISHCPYCGHVGHDCWWTQPQADYLSAVAANEVVGPQLKKMASDFNRKSGRGLISMNMSVKMDRVPSAPVDFGADWPIATFACCGETIKHDGKASELVCIICGKSIR